MERVSVIPVAHKWKRNTFPGWKKIGQAGGTCSGSWASRWNQFPFQTLTSGGMEWRNVMNFVFPAEKLDDCSSIILIF
jgi:hypothetical protein